MKKNYIIIFLLISIIGISIGYIRFASVLSLEVKNNYKWDVHIDSINLVNKENDAYEISKPTKTLYSATYNVGFVNINDSITYEIKVKNKGNIDAKLNSITILPNNDNIIKDFNNLYVGEVLKSGEEKIFKLKLTLNKLDIREEKETIILDYIQY